MMPANSTTSQTSQKDLMNPYKESSSTRASYCARSVGVTLPKSTIVPSTWR